MYYYSCAACGAVEREDAHTFTGAKNADAHVGGTALSGQVDPDHKTQTAGYSGDTYCLGCGVMLSSGHTVLPEAHREGTDWRKSETEHWKVCVVSGCGVELENTRAAHSYDGEDDLECGICGYRREPVHRCGNGTLVSGQAPTCTEDGWWDVYQCSCGKYYTTADCTENIPDLSAWRSGEGRIEALKHAFTKQVYDDARHWKECARCGAEDTRERHAGGTATCQERAVCAVCGQPYGDNGEHDYDRSAWGYRDADGHAHCCQTQDCTEHDTVIAHISSGAATETEPEICLECDYVIRAALGHTHRWVLVDETLATCRQPGKAAHYRCEGCQQLALLENEDYVSVSEADLVIPVNEDNHTGVLGGWQSDADDHWKEYSCCGARAQEAAHTWEDATCTEPKTCAVCKATEGNALGHDHSVSLDNGTPADCTTDGREPDMKCSRCADVQRGAVIPASGHSAGAAVVEDSIAATCTAGGSYVEVVYCRKCNAEISRTQKTTPVLGHVWGEWTVITPATEEAEGVKQRSCQNDPQHIDQQSIPKLPARPVGPKPAEKPQETPGSGFVDVPEESYFREAVDWAVKNGITTGVDTAHFAPDGICTRGQVVTFLWRAAGCPAPQTEDMPFADVTPEAYYYRAVLWAVEHGVTKGTGATAFSPDDSCTRGRDRDLHLAEQRLRRMSRRRSENGSCIFAGPVIK